MQRIHNLTAMSHGRGPAAEGVAHKIKCRYSVSWSRPISLFVLIPASRDCRAHVPASCTNNWSEQFSFLHTASTKSHGLQAARERLPKTFHFSCHNPAHNACILHVWDQLNYLRYTPSPGFKFYPKTRFLETWGGPTKNRYSHDYDSSVDVRGDIILSYSCQIYVVPCG